MHKVYNFLLQNAIVNEQNVKYIFNTKKSFHIVRKCGIMLSKLKKTEKGE